jgi:uncharacterized protein YndB with AHSA1/START domain
MIQVEFNTLIQKPVAEVYAFLAVPANLPRWQKNIQSVTPISQDAMTVGKQYRTSGEILGRKIDGIMTITSIEPAKSFGYKGQNGPMQIQATFTFKPLGANTKLTLNVQGEPGGMFKLAEGMLVNQMKGMMEGNLATLKALLETA